MDISREQYDKMVKKASPPSPVVKNCVKAFITGGAICCLGELLLKLYTMAGMGDDERRTMVSVTLIVLTAALTAIGVFDRIARHAGAGTIVPITGFANSVVSPALEFRSEGFIMGTGASIFRIAGPVILYSAAAAVLYGIFYFVIGRLTA